MFPICLQMHQACFLLWTLHFSVLKWNWTHSFGRMGRIQGGKVNISRCWWFCYEVPSSENILKLPLQVTFLWKGPFNQDQESSNPKPLRSHTLIWFLCIKRIIIHIFVNPSNSIPLPYNVRMSFLSFSAVVLCCTLLSVGCLHPRIAAF